MEVIDRQRLRSKATGRVSVGFVDVAPPELPVPSSEFRVPSCRATGIGEVADSERTECCGGRESALRNPHPATESPVEAETKKWDRNA